MPQQTLSQAVRKANQNGAENALDNFGTGKNSFLTGENLTVVENIVGEFIKRVKTNIESSNMVVTGKIEDIKIETKDGVVNVLANSWLNYQDKGVNGAKVKLYNTPYSFNTKRPPLQPFLQWVEFRGLQDEEGDSESVAYAIREKVFQEGMKPRNVYSKEIPKLIEDITAVIGDIAISVITTAITK